MPMLSHCANAQCSKPFLRLREGKLFLVETGRAKPGDSEAPPFLHRQPQRHVERYWLCDQCAAVWTLIHDKEQGIRLTPLPRPAASVPAAMAAKWGIA
jgi:hypothetical protein